MNEERIMKVIIAPHVSEKASRLAEEGQYVFEVLRDATKIEVAKAVNFIFKVDVKNVCICRVKSKPKRMGRTKQWKKAYVILEAGQKIAAFNE